MKVLVTAASRHGGTAELATELGARLREVAGAGSIDVEVRPMGDVTTLDGYDAVVLGSGVYLGRWLDDARQFIRVHAAELRAVPVWLFSSGPVGEPLTPDADRAVDVDAVVSAVSPVEHRVFPGRVDRDRLGLAERAALRALRVRPGDFRDWAAVRRWAAEIGHHLASDGAQGLPPVRSST